jgi:hypothetical protein
MLGLLSTPGAAQAPPARGGPDYQASSTCQGCHDKIVEQHLGCGHETSFTNPAFQAQYFQELLPQAAKDPALAEEARACIACHAPIFFKKSRQHVTQREQVDPGMSGVTCDLCHTISGYDGAAPGNGNFLSEPSQQKLGPFRHAGDWHHVYSELQTKSEFCAICHNAVNHHGIEIKSTFTEWKNSRYAREGIQCQDCHMTLDGFLTAGKAAYDSGKAATMTLGQAPPRARLYTHRFPGAHSKSQVAGAITLAIETDRAETAPGREIAIRVVIDNQRTGHKMPSGSADLRQLYLTLEAETGGRQIAIPAASAQRSGSFDVAGAGVFDERLLGGDIPKGSRLYRTIFLDRAGRPTLASYQAARVAFDNRLDAGEVRTELYRFTVPVDARGGLRLTARLFYLSYPGPFAARLGLTPSAPVEVAAATTALSLR